MVSISDDETSVTRKRTSVGVLHHRCPESLRKHEELSTSTYNFVRSQTYITQRSESTCTLEEAQRSIPEKIRPGRLVGFLVEDRNEFRENGGDGDVDDTADEQKEDAQNL